MARGTPVVVAPVFGLIAQRKEMNVTTEKAAVAAAWREADALANTAVELIALRAAARRQVDFEQRLALQLVGRPEPLRRSK